MSMVADGGVSNWDGDTNGEKLAPRCSKGFNVWLVAHVALFATMLIEMMASN